MVWFLLSSWLQESYKNYLWNNDYLESLKWSTYISNCKGFSAEKQRVIEVFTHAILYSEHRLCGTIRNCIPKMGIHLLPKLAFGPEIYPVVISNEHWCKAGGACFTHSFDCLGKCATKYNLVRYKSGLKLGISFHITPTRPWFFYGITLVTTSGIEHVTQFHFLLHLSQHFQRSYCSAHSWYPKCSKPHPITWHTVLLNTSGQSMGICNNITVIIGHTTKGTLT